MVDISEIVRSYVPEPVIVGFCRTPFGKYRGGLSHLKATELGSKAIRGLLGSLEIDPRSGVIDGVYMGMVLQAGAGQAPARQASLGAGLHFTIDSSSSTTASTRARGQVRSGNSLYDSMNSRPALARSTTFSGSRKSLA